jgi:ABC-2 type transport system permease protein
MGNAMIKMIFPLMAKSIYKDAYMLVWSILLPMGLFIGLGTYHEADSYRENLLIGCILISLVMGAINTSGFWTMTQRRRGVFKLLKLSSLSISRFIFCSILARLLIFALISALLLLTGNLLFGLTFRVTGLLILIGLLFIGSVCFTSIGYILASRARDEGMMNMMSTLVSFPMIFISSAFYPLDHAPQWIQTVSKLNPFEHASRIGKEALAGGIDTQSAIVLAMMAFVSAIVAVKTFRYD